MMKAEEKQKKAEQWLERETKKGNRLAEMYSALLKNARPEIRAKYHEMLHDMMEGMRVAVAESRRKS